VDEQDQQQREQRQQERRQSAAVITAGKPSKPTQCEQAQATRPTAITQQQRSRPNTARQRLGVQQQGQEKPEHQPKTPVVDARCCEVPVCPAATSLYVRCC
jgi:hypothetical protein